MGAGFGLEIGGIREGEAAGGMAERGWICRFFPCGAKLRAVCGFTGMETRELLAVLDTANGTERDLGQRKSVPSRRGRN